MRNIKIAPDEYYHILNRGSNKQIIFLDKNDRIRFLFLILHFQSAITFENISRAVKEFAKSLTSVQHSVLNRGNGEIDIVKDIVKSRTIELVAFCMMPNHFHLIIKEVKEAGIAGYMQRVLNSYTKYFNTKYQRSGHLFQGPYKAVHIQSDKQLLYLSAYIHRNPRELKEWFGKEKQYTWSSYQDFTLKNRFDNLLLPDIITGQFKNKGEYQEFLNTSTAKTIEGELEEVILKI
jgi:putative transposase